MTEIAERPAAAGEAGAELAHINHWINGGLTAGTSGRRGPVYDPATGQQSKWVDFASVEEVDAAVAAATAAFPGWRSTSLSRRTEIMFRIRNLVDSTGVISRRCSPPSTARCLPTRWARWRAVWRISSSRAGFRTS